jgi:hypothetical protein
LLAFLCFPFLHAAAQVAETPREQHIRAVYKLLQERRANSNLQGQDLYDQLTDTASFKLPVGIGGATSGQPPVIIDSIRFLPDHAEITVYLVVQLPGSERELMFAASSIPISRKGGLTGTARLELVNDVALNPFGDSTSVVVKSEKTFAEFDCNGFKRIGIGAEIALSPKLVKENPDASQNLQERVRGYFEAQGSDLNDLIATVSIDPFQVRGVKGVTFSVQDAVIDLSDLHNSAGMVFPAEYSRFYGQEDLALWRGFYIKRFTVTLPPEIKDRKQNGRRKTFAVTNALIDEKGFSGAITAPYLLPLEDGDMGGWTFSIEQLTLGFAANQLQSGSLAGRINVPITGDTTTFGYSAIFHPGQEYVFTVSPGKELNFSIFKAAHVQLASSSFLEVAVRDSRFVVAANLTGKLSIDGDFKGEDQKSDKSSKLAIPQLEFEQLVISTEAPYIHSGTFALTGGGLPKLGGYGLSIDHIRFVKDGDERGIGFDVQLNLMGDNNAFAASAGLAVLGKISQDENGRHHYRYSRTKISSITIDVDQGPFALHGSLIFFNGHDIYGDGFRGDIDAKLKIGSGSNGFRVAASALFGNVSGNRYWYADVLIEFPGAIPIFPPVMAKGFGGGLYYGVKQIGATESAAGYELGATPTGVVYRPDINAGLGIKASISFTLANEKVLNGNIGFEMAFNRGGGVSRITFRGQCNVITAPMPGVLEKIKSQYPKLLQNSAAADRVPGMQNSDASGQISVNLLVDVDFDNNVLYSNLKAYVNVIGGALKGIGPDGLAGEGVMYVGPDGWYMHMGTPDNPIGIEILGLARAHSYFMVGKDLPGSPPPPGPVAAILGGDLDYMRDMNALGKGSGFAFGAGLDFDTGDMTFLIFYARLAAGLGFDVMLKNYGNLIRCEGSNGPVGVNGWYANGQVYAYFQGKIGIKVNLLFKKGRFDILSLGAAVVLQAKLPNPTWMRGVVGGRFSILGGLVSGNCRFEVTLGKECKLVNQNLFAEAGVQVIGDVTPGSGEGDVDIFSAPQLVFNMPVGKNFNITDDDNKVHIFRARLEYFNIRDNKSQNVPGDMEWNEDNTVVAIKTPDVLMPNTTFRITARVAFEENTNGSWTAYLVDGKPYAEEVDQNFTTGKGPDVIPDSRVSYTYPIRKQLNYYKQETRQGYIWLTQGMPYMFDPGAEFRQVARIIPEGGAPVDFNFSYSSGHISFNMPEGVQNDKVYTLQLVNVPVSTDNSVDRNVQTQQTSTSGGEAGSLAVQTRTAKGSLTNATEKVFYQLSFRTSKYNTFSEKIDKLGLSYAFSWPLANGISELGYVIDNAELFDAQEVDAQGNSQVLQFEAVLDDNNWYRQNIYPYVYEGYPVSPHIQIDWRNISTLGAPPVKAIYIRQQPKALTLEAPAATTFAGRSTFVYNLPYYMAWDYMNIQNKVVNSILPPLQLSLTETQKKIISTPFKPITTGPYRFNVKYVLPGAKVVTSVKTITIQNTPGM